MANEKAARERADAGSVGAGAGALAAESVQQISRQAAVFVLGSGRDLPTLTY